MNTYLSPSWWFDYPAEPLRFINSREPDHEIYLSTQGEKFISVFDGDVLFSTHVDILTNTHKYCVRGVKLWSFPLWNTTIPKHDEKREYPIYCPDPLPTLLGVGTIDKEIPVSSTAFRHIAAEMQQYLQLERQGKHPNFPVLEHRAKTIAATYARFGLTAVWDPLYIRIRFRGNTARFKLGVTKL